MVKTFTMSPSFLGSFTALLILANMLGFSLALPGEKSILRSSCSDLGGICTNGEGYTDCYPPYEDHSVKGCDSNLTCCFEKPSKREASMPIDERSDTCTGADGNYYGPSGYIGITDYIDYEDCTWVISVNTGYVVYLQWLHMDVESCSTCICDSVEIFDGATGMSLGQFCGRDILPSNIISSSNTVTVVFTSDYSVVGTGFQIYYYETYPDYTTLPLPTTTLPPPTTTLPPPTTPEPYCSADDGLRTCKKGKIILGNYTNYEYCRWEIRVREDRVIKMRWLFLDIEYQSTCDWDSVEVFDLVTGNSLSGKVCGNVPPEDAFFSTSNAVEVIFTSDFIIPAGGFTLKYKAVPAPP